MADFIIPAGKAFQFTIKIIEKDSFLAQDVETFDDVNSSMQFRSYLDEVCVVQNTGEITMEKVADDNLAITVAIYADLPVTGSLTAIYTVTDTATDYLWNGTDYEVTTATTTYRGGYIKVVMLADYTTRMVPRRGEIVDGLYLKPAYEAVFTIAFTDPEINTRTVLVDNIYVVPASC
jgi:hypothetical protein